MRSAACACALSFAGVPATLAAAPAAGPGAGSVTAPPERQEPLALDFDILAQDLGPALARYAVIADQTVLFSDEVVAGRRSPGVRGRHAPREALDLLLAGTQLRAERVGAGATTSFVLRVMDVAPLPLPAAAANDRLYDGLVQRRVWEALCARGETAPGRYRAVLMLEVDATGRLLAPRLVATTGSLIRDQAIVAALHGLRLDAAPPARLGQPLALLILPRAGAGAGAGADTDGAACPEVKTPSTPPGRSP
jgi:hypothetical protein